MMIITTGGVELCGFVTIFSRRLMLVKSSWAISHVSCLKLPTFQAPFLSPLSGFIYGTEMVPETSASSSVDGAHCP
jgi:hypothetical protein